MRHSVYRCPALASARFSAKNSTERNAQERLRDRLGEILTRADLAHDDDREGLEERKKVGDVIRQVKWKDFRTRQRELGANARTAKKRAAFVLAANTYSLRVVDGEVDNTYSPTKTPIKVM